MHHEKPLSYGKLQKYLNAMVTKVNGLLNVNFKGKMKLHFPLIPEGPLTRDHGDL